MKPKIKFALALAAVPAMLALASGPASAADPSGGHWDLTGVGGDIAGAWAKGDWWQASDGRWHLSGTLKDTGNNDGMGAAFRLHAVYADGGTRDEEVWNTAGYGTTVPIGEYNFAASVRRFELQECLLLKRSNGSIYVGYCAPSTGYIYI